MRLIDADALIENIENVCCKPCKELKHDYNGVRCRACQYGDEIDDIDSFHTAEQPHWILCSENVPEDIRPVIVTWKNTDPESYYQYIVGKHFTGTACYKNGKWYWYSSITEDMLAEYGRYDLEEFDEAIECIAWMPLPEPYMEGEQE